MRRGLGLSSLAFDLSVYDLFGLFAAGGAVVLPPADADRDPAAWLARLHAEDPSAQLLFRGDARVEYGKIRDVFHECQNMGFAYIQLAVGAQKDSWDE